MKSPLAVILSACRTPIGGFGGALKDHSAAGPGRHRHPRSDRPRRDRCGRRRRCDSRVRPAVRRRDECRATGGDQGWRTGGHACGNDQPGLRLGASGRRPCRGGRARRLHRRDCCRRHRIDVQRAVRAEGRALGVSDGPRRNRGHDDPRRPDRRDEPLSHGHDRGGSRDAVCGVARGSGSLCRRESAQGCRGHRERRLQGRDRRRPAAAEKGAGGAVRSRRIPARRDNGRKARCAETRLQEGRRRHRRQCLRHQ